MKPFNFHWTWYLRWTGYKQVKILLTRLDSTDYGVFGHLELDDHSFDCVTLENHALDIPVGTYPVHFYNSPEHGEVPLIEVPGRTCIEIHEGNWERNSKGCILVGHHRDGDAIDDSRTTLAKLIAALKNKGEMSIVIS